MAAIANNTENWHGHTKQEVENHIKARLNATVASSSIQPLGFDADNMYNPATDTYPTYIYLLNCDGTDAVVQGPTKTTSDGHYIISMRIGNLVKQSRSTSNNYYPILIAGMQYANMTSGNAYQTYYNSTLTVNPSTGAVKAAKFVNSSNNYEAVFSNINNFQIKVVTSQSQVGSESNILYVVVSS